MAHMKITMLSYIFACFLIIPYACKEPHCSTFHYEEKLLEKMVRLEFKLEKMENGYREMEKIIREEKRKVQEDRVQSNERMDKFLEDGANKLKAIENGVKSIGETMLKDVQDATSALEVTQRQNEAKIVRLSEDTRKLQNETLKIIINKVPDVFFKTKNLHSLNVGTDKIFEFKTAPLNEGEGYDTGSGVFTAPIGGDYLFTAQMCNAAGAYVDMTYIVDDVEQPPMSIQSSKISCSTAVLWSRLTKGAKVWLKSKGDSVAVSDSFHENTFSGILLKI